MMLVSVKIGKCLTIFGTSCIVILFALWVHCAETKNIFLNKGSVLLVDTIGTIIPLTKETALSITIKQSSKKEGTDMQSIVNFATLVHDVFSKKIGKISAMIAAQGKAAKNKEILNFNKKYARKNLPEAIPIAIDFVYDTAADMVCSATFTHKAKHYMVRIKRYTEHKKAGVAQDPSPLPLEMLKVRSVSF